MCGTLSDSGEKKGVGMCGISSDNGEKKERLGMCGIPSDSGEKKERVGMCGIPSDSGEKKGVGLRCTVDGYEGIVVWYAYVYFLDRRAQRCGVRGGWG